MVQNAFKTIYINPGTIIGNSTIKCVKRMLKQLLLPTLQSKILMSKYFFAFHKRATKIEEAHS